MSKRHELFDYLVDNTSYDIAADYELFKLHLSKIEDVLNGSLSEANWKKMLHSSIEDMQKLSKI